MHKIRQRTQSAGAYRVWKFTAVVAIVLTLSLLFPLSAAFGADGAPEIPHGTAGYEACLTCHGAGGLKPVPVNHASFGEGTCLSCHSAAQAPTEAETTPESPTEPGITPESPTEPPIPQPISTPPTISHGTAGYEACLTCHGAGGLKPVPVNHASFDEESCLSCHGISEATSAEDNYCLTCHGQSGLIMTFQDGEVSPLYIDPQVYDASIHGDKLLCTDCHRNISTYPHPETVTSSKREYSIAQYELCKQCHFANYTKTLDSIHFEVFSSGNLQAPICTDCHGAHNVSLPAEPRPKISQTCSRCHEYVYDIYAGSVHGKALIEENNYDVPVCTDCHRAHNIENPTTTSFRLGSVELCSECHSNKDLVEKYGISTNVVKSYLNDFHGRTVALISEEGKDIPVREAVCTDCHGVHDIQMVDNPNSPVIKANLVKTCQKCHPGATTNFPGAWLSHYEPSISKAPFVFFVGWFYRILIPFILIGLAIHIMLDLWRRITNR